MLFRRFMAGENDSIGTGYPRYEAINRESTACMRQLREELSEHGKKAFDRYGSLEEQLAEISEQDAFIKGVRIGVQFILDAIGEYPSQLPQCWADQSFTWVGS